MHMSLIRFVSFDAVVCHTLSDHASVRVKLLQYMHNYCSCPWKPFQSLYFLGLRLTSDINLKVMIRNKPTQPHALHLGFHESEVQLGLAQSRIGEERESARLAPLQSACGGARGSKPAVSLHCRLCLASTCVLRLMCSTMYILGQGKSGIMRLGLEYQSAPS